MKTLLCFLSGLICFISFSAGQVPYEKRKIIQEKASEEYALQHQLHLQNGTNLSHHPGKNESLKSAELKWGWDTVYTYDTSGVSNRLTRTFDQFGNVILELKESRENNEWVIYSKREFTYDSMGNNLTETYSKWEYNAWQISEKSTYTYYSNGNLKTDLWEYYIYGSLYYADRISYSYDDYGNMAEALIEGWLGYYWENLSKEIVTCDPQGNWLTYLSFLWANGVWMNDTRITFTYNELGQWLTDVYEKWQYEEWVYTYKYIYSWDENNNLSAETDLTWNAFNGWENNSRYTYSYNGNNKLVTLLGETWQYDTWVNDLFVTRFYDSADNLLAKVHQYWQNTEWVNIKRYTFTFDLNGNSLTGLYEEWISGEWQPAISILRITVLRDEYAYYLGFTHRFQAHFISFINGIDAGNETKRNDLSIHPNPASINITISTKEMMTGNHLEIIDLTGKELFSQEMTGNRMDVDVSTLPRGIYLVRIAGERNMYTGKFVRE